MGIILQNTFPNKYIIPTSSISVHTQLWAKQQAISNTVQSLASIEAEPSSINVLSIYNLIYKYIVFA